jgi:hypothetical protein
MDDGMPFPCSIDPRAELYHALGIGRHGWRVIVNPGTYANYWRAWRRGARQGRITGDPRRLSGVAILDADAGSPGAIAAPRSGTTRRRRPCWPSWLACEARDDPSPSASRRWPVWRITAQAAVALGDREADDRQLVIEATAAGSQRA